MKWPALFLLLPTLALAGEKSEEDYQREWCPRVGGEYQGPRTIVREPITRKLVGYMDCLTDAHVIEIDFGPSYKECIGQALTYATFSGRRGACALITHIGTKYYRQAEAVIETNNLPIDLLLITP